jgi:Carboxypeptidase regulatory-like domain
MRLHKIDKGVNMMRRSSLIAASSLLAIAAPAYAQETTASLRGSIVSEGGAPVANAAITLVHQPSGTRSAVVTDAGGGFSVQGLRVGGPYQVTVAASGFQTKTVTEIFATLGEPTVLNTTLAAESAAGEIVVTAQRAGATTLTTGPQTSLNRDDIQDIASNARDVRDLVRRDPLASFDPNPRGRAISLAGSNPRTNRFTIDGVGVGDSFGLNTGGLPSARGIVAIDAIDQLTVRTASSDISEGEQQGGSINVVLRSGNNNFTGSVLGIIGGDDLQSKKSFNGVRVSGAAVTPTTDRLIVNPKFRTYGGFLSGPIIKDKLFFAVAYEYLTESQVNTTGIAGEGFATELPFITRAKVNQVRQILQSRYNYNALDVPRVLPEKDRKASARLDWNIAPGQRLSLTYIYHKNEVPRDVGNIVSATTPQVGLQSQWYLLGEQTQAYTGQLNSTWSSAFSTQLRITHRDYKRAQTPYAGLTFPDFNICLDDVSGGPSNLTCNAAVGVNPSGIVAAGPDQFRHSNALAVKNSNVSLTARIALDRNEVKLLAEGAKVSVNNLFVPSTRGRYYFDSIADLQAGRANQLTYANALTGNPNDAAAIFDYWKFAFGIQSTYQATPDLTLIAGLRYDWLRSDKPVNNARFTNAYGFTNQNMPKDGVLQPRFGLDWKAGRGFRVSAGGGLFSGGTPDVWIANSFSNDGTRQNSVLIRRTATGFVDANLTGAAANISNALGTTALDNVSGGNVPSAVQQYLAGVGAPPAAAVGAIDPNFQLSSVWKANLLLGWKRAGWDVGLTALATRTNRTFNAVDLRTSAIGTLPDGRPRYNPTVGANWDIVLRNNNQGRAFILGASVAKQLGSHFDIGASYTWSDVKDVGSYTGFTPTELYGVPTADANAPAYGRSRFETRHNAKLDIGYKTTLFGDNELRINLFGEVRSGLPFSYTMNDTAPGRSNVFGTIGGGARNLLYVPDFAQAATLDGVGGRPRVGVVEFTDQATLDSFRGIVDATKLKGFYGRIAPRNLGRSPTYTKLDLHVSQQVPFVFGKFRLFADVENVLNLINRNWNTYKVFAESVPIINVSCVAQGANPCGRYLYATPNNQSATLFQSASLWQIRLGAKFEF